MMFTSWGGAQYLDWWLVVHLLAGVSLGYACRVFGFSLIQTFIAVSIILVGWEVYEKAASISEPWTNSVLDLIVGVVGIFLAYQIVLFEVFGMSFLLASVLLLVWGSLNLWGWFAWKAREARLSQVQAVSETVMIDTNVEDL